MTKTEEGWRTASGYFWIYYNTHRGREPSRQPNERELWEKSPWIIKHFKSREASLSKDPDPSDWLDIYAQELRNDNSINVKSVYVDRPPNRGLGSSIRYVRAHVPPLRGKEDSIKYVRAYLWIEGTIKYR